MTVYRKSTGDGYDTYMTLDLATTDYAAPETGVSNACGGTAEPLRASYVNPYATNIPEDTRG